MQAYETLFAPKTGEQTINVPVKAKLLALHALNSNDCPIDIISGRVVRSSPILTFGIVYTYELEDHPVYADRTIKITCDAMQLDGYMYIDSTFSEDVVCFLFEKLTDESMGL